MTTRLSLLLSLCALAPARGVALAQEPPRPKVPYQVRRDLLRAVRIMHGSSVAYARLRSYSGRFETAGRYGEASSGEIRFARPNRLALRIDMRGPRGAYTRRALSDGRFFYESDSRAGGTFVKRPVPKGQNAIGEMLNTALGMAEIARMVNEPDRFKAAAATTSIRELLQPALAPPPKPGRYKISIINGQTTEIRTTHADGFKETLRYGPDKLLREVASEYPAPNPLREYEKHFDVRANPTLPASTFAWKPAPGAREVSAREFAALGLR